MQLINPTSSYIPDPPSTGGIEAYTNVTSVAQGEIIHFHVWIQGATQNDPAPFSIQIKRVEDVEISITTLDGFSWEQPTNDELPLMAAGGNQALNGPFLPI